MKLVFTEKYWCTKDCYDKHSAVRIYSAYRGQVTSLRRTGRASADIATGSGVLSLPQAYALRGLA